MLSGVVGVYVSLVMGIDPSLGAQCIGISSACEGRISLNKANESQLSFVPRRAFPFCLEG